MSELPPLGALRAFEIVYRTGGVRAAARELNITHSSVSRHIGELEAWLAVSLFERVEGRRNLELTAAGRQLGQTTNEAFRDIARTVSSVRERRRKNEVVVSTTQSFATRWLLPRLHHFADKFPHIEISVRVDQRITDFKNDPADLALRMGPGTLSGVEAVPLMDDVLFPVISARLMKQYGYLSAELILRRFPLLHDLDPDAGWALWKNRYGPDDLDLNKGPQLTSTDLILRAASLDQGVALARAALAKDDLDEGQLMRLSDQQIYIKDAYWLVLPMRRTRPDYVMRFIDWIKQEAEETRQNMAEKFGNEA